MPQIEMLIDAEGNVKITKVEGIDDLSCLEVTKPYEKALGMVRESRREITIDVPPEELHITT